MHVNSVQQPGHIFSLLDSGFEVALTGPGSDVWHVNQGAGVLDEGGVVDRHTCAEALRVSSLVELCVCHRYSSFIFTCRESRFSFTTAEHKTRRSPDTRRLALPQLTNLLDAFFVFDQQLHPRDVDVQARALRGPLHRSVKAAVVFTGGGWRVTQAQTLTKGSFLFWGKFWI